MPRIVDRGGDQGQSAPSPPGTTDPHGVIMPCRILARQTSGRPGQARISDIDVTPSDGRVMSRHA
jgi:hypothetical protein